MTEDGKPKPPKLKGEAALNLWRQGRDAWNSWIDQNPGLLINFSHVDFSTERDSEESLSFTGYNFGDGNVNFFRATFGDGNVDFSNATFGDGGVNFSESTFGNGQVDFDNAIFGSGELVFFRTNFGDSDLIFSDTTFIGSKLILIQAKLNQLFFLPKSISSGSIEAKSVSIASHAILRLPPSAIALKSFDLFGASLDGPLALSGNLGIVPDLRATRYSHQVELSELNVKLPRAWQGLGWPPKLSTIAKNIEDAAKLRRLKEIAETNKDHQAALRFSADENRARRWIETSWFGSVLDMAFSACSNYGQSILRPFVALFVLAVASMGLYKKLAVTTEIAWRTGPGWGQSLLLSISNSLPFLPQSRGLREAAQTALYSTATDPGFWIDALMIGQGALSFVFLFLIGLGLRNRFRL